MIQARLGHKSTVETMDTYGHLFPDGRDETTSALDRIFGAIGAAETSAAPRYPGRVTGDRV